MQRITVNYAISRTTALTEGRAEYGTNTYQPSDTELAFLCVADRDYLDKHERETFNLPTSAPPTWPVIADAVRAARVALEERTAKAAADLEARIVEALAKPDDDWLFQNTYGWSWRVPGAYTGDSHDDDRIKARIEALRPELERREVERKAREAESRAQREAEQQAKDAARVAALESITAWALASDDAALARAARDGYEVANAVLRRVADALASSLQVYGRDPEVSTEGTKHWARWNFEDRAAPSAAAFGAYDDAKTAVDSLDKPEGVKVELHRIARVTVDAPDDDPDGQDDIYTAIVVMISAPGTGTKDRAVIVRVDK